MFTSLWTTCMVGIMTMLFNAISTVKTTSPESANDSPVYKVMFYNVENLFDVADDPRTSDEDFTPSGVMHWTTGRYNYKLRNIGKVIIATGGWKPVDIIGLCEIENKKVLQDLVTNTTLSKFPYRIIHKDSPDRRGIDVALLYNQETVGCLKYKYFEVKKGGLHTRDILYVKLLLGKDTCNLFINHWPSRSAGQLETEGDRFAAARLLKHLTDSLFTTDRLPEILIMGDFNDEPDDNSLVNELQVQKQNYSPVPQQLYNLTRAPSSGAVRGTLKYQGQWNTFDQIIASGSLFSGSGRLAISAGGYQIMQNMFLLKTDEMYNGYKPFRTYNGFRYQGGFSDHLPVYVELNSGVHPGSTLRQSMPNTK